MSVLSELRDLIGAHARSDLRTSIDGLLLSRVETVAPDYSLTEPLLVVMAQGGKRLLLGDQVFEYRAGQFLIVTTDLPVTGYFLDATPQVPALGLGLALRPAAIAPLLLAGNVDPKARVPAMATGDVGPDLLDALVRLLRLLDHRLTRRSSRR